jgi:hypothetical protein
MLTAILKFCYPNCDPLSALERTHMAASAHEEPGRPVERLLVAAGALWIVGAVVSFVGGTLHPHRELPNDHPAVFAEYAASTNWLWVHYLQFAAALTVVAGFLVLYEAMSRRGVVSVLERSGYAAAIATALIFAANMAVDGIAFETRCRCVGCRLRC